MQRRRWFVSPEKSSVMSFFISVFSGCVKEDEQAGGFDAYCACVEFGVSDGRVSPLALAIKICSVLFHLSQCIGDIVGEYIHRLLIGVIIRRDCFKFPRATMVHLTIPHSASDESVVFCDFQP